VADQDKVLRRIQRLSERVTAADTKAESVRAEFRKELADARAAGVTVSAMARALGVSRQRVQQLLRRDA